MPDPPIRHGIRVIADRLEESPVCRCRRIAGLMKLIPAWQPTVVAPAAAMSHHPSRGIDHARRAMCVHGRALGRRHVAVRLFDRSGCGGKANVGLHDELAAALVDEDFPWPQPSARSRQRRAAAHWPASGGLPLRRRQDRNGWCMCSRSDAGEFPIWKSEINNRKVSIAGNRARSEWKIEGGSAVSAGTRHLDKADFSSSRPPASSCAG